jgi:hypothetical protein
MTQSHPLFAKTGHRAGQKVTGTNLCEGGGQMARGNWQSFVRGSELVLYLSGVLLAGGCSTLVERADPGAPARRMMLDVTNNHTSDVILYLAREGSRVRLGQVGSLTRQRIRLPAGLAGAGRLQLVVRRFGSDEGFLSPMMPITGDERLELTIENVLSMSSFVLH